MVPVRAVFALAPVSHIWAGREKKTWLRKVVEWQYWAPHYEHSDLFRLWDGDHIYAYLERDYTLEWNGWTISLKAGQNYIQWKDTVEWIPALALTAGALAWAKAILKEVGLYPILEAAGVRKVVAVPGLPHPGWWGPAGGSWGGVNVARAVVVPDISPMPGSYLPAIILHEAVHAWQLSRGLDIGSTSQLLEITAQMGAQLFHFLYDGLEAFGPGPPYGSYANLFKA